MSRDGTSAAVRQGRSFLRLRCECGARLNMAKFNMRLSILRAKPELPIRAILCFNAHEPTVVGHLLYVNVTATNDYLVNGLIIITPDLHRLAHFSGSGARA